MALLQIEIVFLLVLIVVFVIAGLLVVLVFIRAVRVPNRPGGEGRREPSERESEERGRGDRS